MNKVLEPSRKKSSVPANDVKALLEAAKKMESYASELLKKMKEEDERYSCRH
ncbi:MAG: hypothetical protein WCV72_04140 [Patescibacteria group bacterium]|jgi:hypothetical protein